MFFAHSLVLCGYCWQEQQPGLLLRMAELMLPVLLRRGQEPASLQFALVPPR
jgi:hypothetical protein